MNKTSVGLDENVAGLLCYVLGWISGFIIILLERENRFVRFHAMQSIIVFGTITVIWGVISWIPVINVIFGAIIGIMTFILWVVLMVKAYQSEMFKIPRAGDLAEKWIG